MLFLSYVSRRSNLITRLLSLSLSLSFCVRVLHCFSLSLGAKRARLGEQTSDESKLTQVTSPAKGEEREGVEDEEAEEEEGEGGAK